MFSPWKERKERRAYLHDLLTNHKIVHVYQPICDLRNDRVYGHEALLRVKGDGVLQNPLELFALAHDAGLSYELDREALSSGLLRRPQGDGYLFLNILPSTLVHERFWRDFPALVGRANIAQSRIVLEITESESMPSLSSLQASLRRLKEYGVLVALDDFGIGSSLQLFLELTPEIIKIDRMLVKEIEQSPRKQMVVRVIQFLCRKNSLILIAEGIETKEELEVLKRLGIRFGQGYLLGTPIFGHEA
ncbi:hypothetical protein BSNK01_05350 [Bacillaceae bacterium]